MQVGTRVPPDYIDSFHRANFTFKHQRVFCPERECLVMWNEPDETLPNEILAFIGGYISIESTDVVIMIPKSHAEWHEGSYIP